MNLTAPYYAVVYNLCQPVQRDSATRAYTYNNTGTFAALMVCNTSEWYISRIQVVYLAHLFGFLFALKIDRGTRRYSIPIADTILIANRGGVADELTQN